MLLKEFEKRENSFANKVNTKLSEKDEMQEKVRQKESVEFVFSVMGDNFFNSAENLVGLLWGVMI